MPLVQPCCLAIAEVRGSSHIRWGLTVRDVWDVMGHWMVTTKKDEEG